MLARMSDIINIIYTMLAVCDAAVAVGIALEMTLLLVLAWLCCQKRRTSIVLLPYSPDQTTSRIYFVSTPSCPGSSFEA